jgi:hypothetical protein
MLFKARRVFLMCGALCAVQAIAQAPPSTPGMSCSTADAPSPNPANCVPRLSQGADVTLARLRVQFDTQGQSTPLPNPNTGYYLPSPEASMPAPLEPFDVYFRFPWKLIEPDKDVYDFSAIEKALRALKKGQRLAFRIMPLNTCCTRETPVANDVPDYFLDGDTPESGRAGAQGWYYKYSTLYKRTKIYVPDWNDEFYLNRVEKLLQKLGQKYDGDPRINWVEIGLYGNWGEWHTYPISYPDNPDSAKLAENPREYLLAPADSPSQKFRPGTPEARTRVLRAYAKAFKQTRLIALTSGILEALKLDMPKPIGFRRDSWGHSMHADLEAYAAKRFTDDDLRLIFSRWKTAPFYAESWGYGHAKEASYTMDLLQQLEFFHTSAMSFAGFFPEAGGFSAISPSEQALYIKAAQHTGYRYAVKRADIEISKGLLTLDTSWVNDGVAPSYDEWVVNTYLYNPDTRQTLSAKVPLPVDLGKLYNDSDYAVDIARLVQKGKTVPIQSFFDTHRTAPQKVVQASGKIDVAKIDFARESAIELRVHVEDRRAYLLPMKLNNKLLNADGSWTLIKLK